MGQRRLPRKLPNAQRTIRTVLEPVHPAGRGWWRISVPRCRGRSAPECWNPQRSAAVADPPAVSYTSRRASRSRFRVRQRVRQHVCLLIGHKCGIATAGHPSAGMAAMVAL